MKKKLLLAGGAAVLLVLMCSAQQARAGIPTGACIDEGACTVLTPEQCAANGGEYIGDDTTCADVPTVSTWGMFVMTLVLLVAGTILIPRLRNRQMPA